MLYHTSVCGSFDTVNDLLALWLRCTSIGYYIYKLIRYITNVTEILVYYGIRLLYNIIILTTIKSRVRIITAVIFDDENSIQYLKTILK